MTKEWIVQDEYFKRAKAEGYVARSAYKLLELQERFQILRNGDRVLDLGCAPGSWMQVTERIVGPRGLVVGIDLQEVTTAFGPNVRHVVGDINRFGKAGSSGTAVPVKKVLGWDQPKEPEPTAADNALAMRLLLDQGPDARYDVVLSDMAPNTSGHGDDHMSARLVRDVLTLMPHLLRPGGNGAIKILEGGDLPEILVDCREIFARVKPFKPRASRDVSRENFIMLGGFRGKR